MTRQCLPCTECCTRMAVKELAKGENQRCRNLTSSGGCGIYADPLKPKICGDFKCAWLEGGFDEEDRPDKSGVIFMQQPSPIGPLLCAFETRPRAAEEGRMKTWIEMISSRVLLVVVRHRNAFFGDVGGSYLLGPADQMEKAGPILTARGFLK